MNRRQFISRSLIAASAAAASPRWTRAGEADRKLNIAVIGALGKGQSDTKNIALDHNVVALVDVDTKRLDDAVTAYQKVVEKDPKASKPKTFTDFRKMFDTMSNGIDAVIVSTPDHTHFSAALWALKHKKHICVQKPLTNTIWEARELHRLSKEAGVVTQMGNQGRTLEGQRAVKEWVEQGVIGTLKEVRLWTNRPIWPQGVLPIRNDAPIPATLDWDAWQGQHPARPYFDFQKTDKDGKTSYDSIHPFKWRGWWDYGSGALGDMGCHVMDCTFNLLGRRLPSRVDIECGPHTERTAPMWTNLVYHMPASDKYAAMPISWNDGIKDGKPNKPERDPRIPAEFFDKASSGMMLIGTNGVIIDKEAYCGNPQIFPAELAEDVKKRTENGSIKKTETRSTHPGNPQLEWAHSIVNGLVPSSNFDYAVPLTEFVQLGNLAIRGGQSIEWDPKTMTVTNGGQCVNRYVKRPGYRVGWV